jgi:mono/diheme cytochrome c family protein
MRTFRIIIFIWIPVIISAFSFGQPGKRRIERGKDLFEANCLPCHMPTRNFVARPIQRIRKYRGKDWAYKVVQNPAKLASENKKAKELFSKSTMMSAFNLPKSDIDAIYDYLDSLPFDPNEYKFRK